PARQGFAAPSRLPGHGHRRDQGRRREPDDQGPRVVVPDHRRHDAAGPARRAPAPAGPAAPRPRPGPAAARSGARTAVAPRPLTFRTPGTPWRPPPAP